MKKYGILHYLIVFARYYFGIRTLISGLNYYFNWHPAGKMLDPATEQFMQAITTIGLYQAVKTIEIVVGLCLVTNRFVPFALVMEFPISIIICTLSCYQPYSVHTLTGIKEVVLNLFLFSGYAGFYLQFLAFKAEQRPLWNMAFVRRARQSGDETW